MATKVRGSRAARLQAKQAHERKLASHRSWLARIIVVCALIGITILATALTYRAPDPTSVATVRARVKEHHGPGCAHWHRIERSSVAIASQVGVLLAPWLE